MFCYLGLINVILFSKSLIRDSPISNSIFIFFISDPFIGSYGHFVTPYPNKSLPTVCKLKQKTNLAALKKINSSQS